MRNVTVPKFCAITAAILWAAPFIWGGEEATQNAATALAMRYLRAIDRTVSLPSSGGKQEDVLFTGPSLGPSGGWRTLVVGGQTKPGLAWDSFTLHDPYLNVTGLSFINTEADSPEGYIVTLRGCVPHQCADGKIGFAIYVSQIRRTYIGHISTREDGSYEISYYPKSGVPDNYRAKLDRMMCSDKGISRPSELPLKCPKK